MAVYIITGKLGSGKTLSVIGRIRDALIDGKRVVTNLNIRVEKMLPPWHRRGELIRIPDKPILSDLQFCGVGSESLNEEKFGLIVLDELGTWLNARSFQDPSRQPVIDWLLHSRKLGWDVYFIVQNLNMIDKQVRDGLAEFVVTCRRTDRFKVPLLGHFGLKVPKYHVAFVRYGAERDAPTVDRWIYRGRDLYGCYDTRQVFRPRDWPGAVSAPFVVPMPGALSNVKRPEGFWARMFFDPSRPVAAPRGARSWPQSVSGLSPELRWEIARRLSLQANNATPRAVA